MNSIYGNAKTRLNIERDGLLSLESCLELCWYIGLVKYENKSWVDIKTGYKISEYEIYKKYEKTITDILNIQFETKNNNILYKKHILEHDLSNIIINNSNEEEMLNELNQELNNLQERF